MESMHCSIYFLIFSTKSCFVCSQESDMNTERHVGFCSDVEELQEKEGKLRRRDTPHHLKNKRISSKMDPEEKIRQILAQVANKRSSSDVSPSQENDESSPFRVNIHSRFTSFIYFISSSSSSSFILKLSISSMLS